MKIKRSWKSLAVAAVGLALFLAVNFYSKPALAGPAITVYLSPT